ncbi:MAG: diadenylate cyclase CdaA [Clostridia bacterium]|nr:diadenylate cyclase CdaA [Clostridia bacterium]
MAWIENVFQQIGSLISTTFVQPDWYIILDILIVAVIIYYLIRLFIHTRASSLLKGVAIVLLSTWVSELMQLNTLNWILQQIVSTGIVLLVVLFQPELRRALGQIGRSGFWSRLIGVDHNSGSEKIVLELVNALTDLSRKRIGALIVVQRKTGLGDIIASGTSLDAEISAALVENIFEPNTPLHDGAVIINDNRIVAAACILQLTDDISLSRELGTRHRAAIGVSETTDAVALIVSEETGTISTARDGHLTRYLDKKSLTALLTELFVPKQLSFLQWLNGAEEDARDE